MFNNSNFDNMFSKFSTTFNIMFVLSLIFFMLVFIFIILMIFSPKFRARIMGTQIKATKYMIDDNKNNLKDIAHATGDIVNPQITRTVKAFKDGLKDQNYCKYCGKTIDIDSIFCKHCGKKQ